MILTIIMDSRERHRRRRVRSGSGRGWALALCLLPAAIAPLPAAAQGSHAAAEVYFAHGALAFLDGDYQAAADQLQKAVGEDPTEGTYLHWLAHAYLRLGRGADAAARLEESLAAERRSASGEARVRADLDSVRESLARGTALPALPEPATRLDLQFPGEAPRWEGQLGVQAAYDSNPGLLAEDLAVSVPGRSRGDASAFLDLRLDHRPLWNWNGWSLDLNFLGHGALHPDVGRTDLVVARGGLSLGWGRDPGGLVAGAFGDERLPLGGGPVVVLLQAGSLYASFGGDELVRRDEAALTVMVPETHRTATRLIATGRRRDYAAAAGDLRQEEEDEVAAGVDQFLFNERRDRWLRVGVEAGEVRAGRLQAASFTEARAEAEVVVASRWTLSLLGARRDDRYDHPESNLGSAVGPAREDLTWRVTAMVVWQATDRLGWVARGVHVRRDSNVELAGFPLLDFERTVVSAGLIWGF
jgi:hypothetical protein